MEKVIIERLKETIRPLPYHFNLSSFTLEDVFDLTRPVKRGPTHGGRPAVLKAMKRLEKNNSVNLNDDKKTWKFLEGV